MRVVYYIRHFHHSVAVAEICEPCFPSSDSLTELHWERRCLVAIKTRNRTRGGKSPSGKHLYSPKVKTDLIFELCARIYESGVSPRLSVKEFEGIVLSNKCSGTGKETDHRDLCYGTNITNDDGYVHKDRATIYSFWNLSVVVFDLPEEAEKVAGLPGNE